MEESKKIKCLTCKGKGGGYETCEGWYPNIIYYYVEIGECENCDGTGFVHIFDIEDLEDKEDGS